MSRPINNAAVSQSWNTGDSSPTTAGLASRIWGSMTARRKLISFRSIFPHNDNTTVENIAGIYDDLLQFLRPDLYSDSIKRSTLKLVMMQICSRQIYYLTWALKKLPAFEMQHVLSTVMTNSMNDVEQLQDALYREKRKATLSPSTKEVLVLLHVLNFMEQIVAQSIGIRDTVLAAGVFDLLLRIYVVFPTLSEAESEDTNQKMALFDACRSIMIALSLSPPNDLAIPNHPVCILWTDCYTNPIGYTGEVTDDTPTDRGTAWSQADKHCAKRRMILIYKESLWKSDIHDMGDIETCMDIIEFTKPQLYDSEIIELAFLSTLKFITLSGNSARHLMDVLALGSHQDVVRVFSGVIRLWLECVNIQTHTSSEHSTAQYVNTLSSVSGDGMFPGNLVPTNEDPRFYAYEKAAFLGKIANVDKYIYNIIKFATDAADKNMTIRWGMLDAGCLSLVLSAFVSDGFKLKSLTDVVENQGRKRRSKLGRRETLDAEISLLTPISSTMINAEASKLSILIRNAKFRAAWQGERFNTRRFLCLQLVNNLLGGEDMDHEHSVTYTLFKTILQV